MSTSAEKGQLLERAVRVIEQVILEASPAYAEETIRIESRKVAIVDGVRHEVDLWVAVVPAEGYESVFIFECKNWKDKVGKNDIIVFSEKVRALGAQRGFFIAHAFTRDAEAQAKHNNRLRLLRARSLDIGAIPIPLNFHTFGFHGANATLEFRRRDPPERGKPTTFDPRSVEAILDDAPIDLQQFIQSWIEQLKEETLDSFPSGAMAAGRYEAVGGAERTFHPGQLLVDGIDIEAIDVRIRCDVSVQRPAIRSFFDVETRGRAVVLETAISPEGGKIDVVFALPPSE